MATSLPSIGTLIASWSADDITPQTDDTKLTTGWVDGVGSISATQATTAKQAWYRTNRLGGKPSVEFRGGQSLSIGRPASIINAYTAKTVSVFIVFKTTGASTLGPPAMFGSHFLYADGTNVGNYNAPLARGKALPHSGQTSFSTFCATAGATDPAGGGTGIQRYAINGGCVTQVELAIGAEPGSGDYYIGGDPGVNFNFNGEVFDILVWSTVITPVEILQAQMWACEKYGQAYPWASKSYFAMVGADSHGSGVGATAFVECFAYKMMQSLGLSYGQWSNVSIAGGSWSVLNTAAVTDIDPTYALIGKPVKLLAFEWYNSQAASPTPRNAALTYLSNRRTANTKVVFGTSTDTGLTADTNRADYNSYFDANHTVATMDAYIPYHLNAGVGVETAQVDFPGNFVDTIGHFSDAGHTIMAGLSVTGMDAITFSTAASFFVSRSDPNSRLLRDFGSIGITTSGRIVRVV